MEVVSKHLTLRVARILFDVAEIAHKMGRMIRAIFWDNDGVLVDTERLYFQATRQVLQSAGMELTTEMFVELFLVRAIGPWHLLREKGISETDIQGMREERNRIYGRLLAQEDVLKDGVPEVLEILQKKYRMGVVTSSLKDHFEIIHRSTGILKYFEFTVVSGDYTKYKPDPEPYLVALERSGLSPEECVVVEDSLRGLTAAIGAGLTCYVIPNELTRSSDFSGAYRVLSHIRELLPELA